MMAFDLDGVSTFVQKEKEKKKKRQLQPFGARAFDFTINRIDSQSTE